MAEPTDLSEREQEILRLVATGVSNKEIAQELNISANTVKVHLRNIFGKIGVATRTEAAIYAVSTGLIEGILAGEDARGDDLDAADAQELTDHSSGPVEQNEYSGGVQTTKEGAQTGGLRRTSLLAGLILLLVLVVGAMVVFTMRERTTPESTPPETTIRPRWQELAPMPTKRYGFGLVSHGGFLYAVAGFTSGGPTGALERFNPNDNTWQPLPAKPLPVGDVKAAVVGGKIYVPGGQDADGSATDTLDIFDPQSGEWNQGHPLPVSLSAYSLAAYEGKLYVFGGRSGDQYLDRAFAYDPGQDAWHELARMPTARSDSGAAVSGDRIFVIGGRDEQGAVSTNEAFLPGVENPSSAWQIAPAMPEARFGHGVTSVADMIFVVGGQPSGKEAQQPGFQYSPLSGQWQAFQSPGQAAAEFPGLANLGSYLYVMGGAHDQQAVGQAYVYQVIYSILLPFVPQVQE